MSIIKQKIAVLPLNSSDLQNLPGHTNANCVIQRLIPASTLPVHVAVHKVDSNYGINKKYTQPHLHTDEDELNLLIPDQTNLTYEYFLDGARSSISAPAAVWIPYGMFHSANLSNGSGTFVCLRFPHINK